MVRPLRSPVVGLSVLLVLSIVGWIGFDHVIDRLRAPRCTSPVTVTVAAAPGVAQMLSDAAAGQDTTAECYRVEVQPRDSKQTLDTLANEGAADRPDAWVPESTMWLWQARDTGAWQVPESGPSIASSPVVLAVRDGVQERSWRELIGPGATAAAGIADPAKDPAGLSALLAVREFSQAAKDPGATLVAALRGVSVNPAARTSDLYARQLDVFPTSEQDLRQHNAKPGVARLTAVAAEPPVPPLDFPYVVLPDAGDGERRGAENFLSRLRSADAARGLDRFGLRAPPERATLPDQDVVAESLNVWAGLTLSARVLAVLDVSGSMNEAVPGAGQTRMALAVAAAERGMGLFKPTTELGLWKFSTALDGERDYLSVLPVAPIREHLAGDAVQKLRAIRATARGATGLYDSTLAAYREARQKWELGRINIVVIMTDGRNEDARSITQQQLLDELGKLQDKRRPLPVIAIGMGPDVDVQELTRIADATGGRAFTTADPAGISDIFAGALSTMLCQPPACRPQ